MVKAKTAKKAGVKAAKKPAMRAKGRNLLKAADMAKLQRVHKVRPNAEQTAVAMGAALGLSGAVYFVRVPAGKESLPPKLGTPHEEWLYILYGQGVAAIAGRDVEIGPGDFLAFPAPQIHHQVRNTGWEDLVFLTGNNAVAAPAPQAKKAPAKKPAKRVPAKRAAAKRAPVKPTKAKKKR